MGQLHEQHPPEGRGRHPQRIGAVQRVPVGAALCAASARVQSVVGRCEEVGEGGRGGDGAAASGWMDDVAPSQPLDDGTALCQ